MAATLWAIPTDDLVEHTQAECVCGPQRVRVNYRMPNGQIAVIAWAYLHQRLDGTSPTDQHDA